jgi:hypothetical protein
MTPWIAAIVKGLLDCVFTWFGKKKAEEDKSEAESKAAAMKSVGEALKTEEAIRNDQNAIREAEIESEDGGLDFDKWSSKPDDAIPSIDAK